MKKYVLAISVLCEVEAENEAEAEVKFWETAHNGKLPYPFEVVMIDDVEESN